MTAHEYNSARTKGKVSKKVKGAGGSRLGTLDHRDGLTWVPAFKEHGRAPIRKEEGKVISNRTSSNCEYGV